ncbi:MAG: hypothetical protein Q9171_002202 [Xanthocarpia ochracea]
MEDMESFTLVSRPSDDSNQEHSHAPFADYEQQSSATRKATTVQLGKTLRQRYPDHTLAITKTSICDLLGFCTAGKATLNKWDPKLSLWDYQAPRNQIQGQNGNLIQEPIFAEAHITYQTRDFIVYIAECLKEGLFYPLEMDNFILHRISASEAPELGSLYTQELILRASEWTAELHGQIWMFDQGYWSKNRDLWESAQEADWEDVILDEGMKADVRGDVEGFFRERREYQRFAIPWKRGIIFHGPPGNGKTISIRAIMKTLFASLPRPIPTLYVKSFSFNKEYGIRSVFRKARSTAPCLLIFEDVDSLITPQSRSYFLNEVDGLENNEGVLMLGSTNHRMSIIYTAPLLFHTFRATEIMEIRIIANEHAFLTHTVNLLDPSISKRPSRFDRKYLFPLPSTPQRTLYCQYWRSKILAKNSAIAFPEALCAKIAGITEKFSFAYMKEAFVASLLGLLVSRKKVLGRGGEGGELERGGGEEVERLEREGEEDGKGGERDGDLEKLPLWREIKKQVAVLREELDTQSN